MDDTADTGALLHHQWVPSQSLASRPIEGMLSMGCLLERASETRIVIMQTESSPRNILQETVTGATGLKERQSRQILPPKNTYVPGTRGQQPGGHSNKPES